MIIETAIQAVSSWAGLVADLHRTRQTRHPTQHLARIGAQLGAATPHRSPRPGHARSPTWRAHPTRRTRSPLRPPATCGSTGQASACPATHDQLRARPQACSYRLTPKRSRDDGAGRLLDLGEVLRTSE